MQNKSGQVRVTLSALSVLNISELFRIIQNRLFFLNNSNSNSIFLVSWVKKVKFLKFTDFFVHVCQQSDVLLKEPKNNVK